MTATIHIAADEGRVRFDCYVARPEGEARGAIVVIQEIFGINAGIRRKCDRLAEQGYLALAPDLFWRIEPNIELDPDIPAEMQRAFDLMGRFDENKGIADIAATIAEARRELGPSAKVGVVGYCLGGRLAYLSATRTDSDASVGYYGVNIDQNLHEAHAIAKPLLLHVPTGDHFVTPDKQKAMHDGLDRHPKVTLHDYEGLDHGFATEFGKRRDEEGARLADERTAAFFTEHIG